MLASQPSVASPQTLAAQRALRHLLPDAWWEAMDDRGVTDLDIDEYGRLFAKRLGTYRQIGTIDVHTSLSVASALSSFAEVPLDVDRRQSIKTTWPTYNFRTVVQIPPAVGPGASIHVRTTYGSDLTLANLVDLGTFTSSQADHIESEFYNHHNVTICGMPGHGKTTAQRAFTGVLEKVPWIVVIVDALDEIQTTAANIRRKKPNIGYSNADVLDDALLQDPGAIAFGEVRTGKDGIALFRTWLTGTCGGYVTEHTEDAAGVIVRAADFYREEQLDPVYADIARVHHTIIHMQRVRSGDNFHYFADEVVRVDLKRDDPRSPADFALIPVP